MLPQQGHVVLPDGTVVRGRGRRDAPADPPPEFGLYLHRRRGGWEPGWPAQWLDWPDFRTPRDRDAAAGRLVVIGMAGLDAVAIARRLGGQVLEDHASS